MKRARAQQGNDAPQLPDHPDAGNPTKPRRRAKQPRQPKGAKNPAAAAATTTRGEGGPVAIAAVAAAVASPGPGTVPDVCVAGGEADAVDWDLDDAGLGGGAWWTWGVDEEKLLGWFPFVEEDFRCLGGGRAADAEAAFDDDIWRIHQIHQIPSYAAK